ncbi:signal peptidase I [Myxococcota bacterium]|nr:signal peptidase I [Myxococcota bacterium]
MSDGPGSRPDHPSAPRPDGESAPPRGRPAPVRTSGKSTLREYVEAIAIALLIALFLRSFVVEAFKIPSGSMIPTLLIGDHIFVNKLAYRSEIPYSILGIHLPWGGTTLHTWRTPTRGDVVVFRYPSEPDVDYIKRVVGLPGDTVQLRGNDLYVNGEKHPRAGDDGYTYFDQHCQAGEGRMWRETVGDREYTILLTGGSVPFENFGPVKVREGHVFVMGDNRDNSSDSRVWGQVPLANVKGRAMITWLSLDPCGGVSGFIRPSRMFDAIH